VSEISEYDKRQLDLMYDTIIFFENGKLNLSSLVQNLEGLLLAMENVSKNFEEKFLDELATLESINAEMPEIESGEIKKLIKDAVSNLKRIVEGAISCS
jgi:hypothetical protein